MRRHGLRALRLAAHADAMARACLALGVYQARRKRGVSITQAFQFSAEEMVRETLTPQNSPLLAMMENSPVVDMGPGFWMDDKLEPHE